MHKLLVTGSAGHLGEALMRTLRATGQQVIGTDLLASPFTDHVGSISDRDHVRRCMADVDAVIHTATRHKPHVATHSRQDFIDTNITGTLNLLEEATLASVKAFVFTSTTSTFGDALTPAPGEPAAWITEEVVPVPKNIYGVTKVAAETLCELFHRNQQLPCLILRTARFFPEADDSKAVRDHYSDANAKANEYLYRRVDIEDIVSAHLLAVQKAPSIGFGRYIISATTPFTRADLAQLRRDAPAVVKRLFPAFAEIYAQQKWQMLPSIDRVYVNTRARTALGWQPRYDFAALLTMLANGQTDLRSPLAQAVGVKGYHGQNFADGLYPVEAQR